MKKISKSRNRDCAAMVMSGIAAVLLLCQPGDYRHPMVVMLLSGIVVACICSSGTPIACCRWRQVP